MRIVCTILFLLYTSGSYAQVNKVNDSLVAALGNKMPDTSRVNTLNALARNFRNIDTRDALKYGNAAFKLADSIQYLKGKATAGDVLGVIYLNIADYQSALYHLFTSLRLNESLRNDKGITATCNNIGSVYFHMNKYDAATVYYNRSLELKLKLGMIKEASSTYINIANIYMKQDKLQLCIEYYHKALKNAEANQDDYNISVALMNLGEACIDSKNYKLAFDYYKKALVVNEKRMDVFHIANCNYAIGKIFAATQKYEEAEKYLLKANELVTQGNLRSLKLNIYKTLSKLFEVQKKYDLSLQYFKLFHALSDSVYNTESTDKMSEMQAKYESEKKDKQIELLNKDKAITEAKVYREKLLRNSFISAFILICIISGILARNIILKQRVNKILREKNAEIEQQQEEIKRKNRELNAFNKELMKENISARYEILKSKVNPHFLFNSLSTLSSLIIKDPNEALQFVNHFSKLYRSILEFGNHQLVTLDEEMKFVKHYLYLQKMRFKENLQVKIQVDPQLSLHCVPPFAIQLLIENAIKHNMVSNDHPLNIAIIAKDNELKVVNNLQRKPIIEDSTGIGRQNIIDRYHAVTDKAPSFSEDNGCYTATIPLIQIPVNI